MVNGRASTSRKKQQDIIIIIIIIIIIPHAIDLIQLYYAGYY